MRPAALTASLTAALATALVLAAPAHAADAPPAPSTAPVPKGSYQVDKAHTSILFSVSHLGFSAFTGRFTRFEAALTFDPRQPRDSRVQVTIDPASIATDNPPDGFLATLAGAEFLDAGRFPQMTYVSRQVEDLGQGKLRIHGDLTLHGVTRPVTLDARYNGGYAGHPFDPQARIGFSAHGTLKRSQFGIPNGVPAPGSTFGVADDVQIRIETEFMGPPLAGAAAH